ncbi:MAG: GNAT family N-acetyltransferase [Roseburia sp.]
MVCLEKLDRSDFEEVYRIMEQSFPADERRKKEGQQKLLDEEKYELLGVRNEGGLLAFLAVWEFAEFVFIEHFAVSEKARNSGIGGKMLEEAGKAESRKSCSGGGIAGGFPEKERNRILMSGMGSLLTNIHISSRRWEKTGMKSPCGSCQHRNRFQRMSFRACAQNYTKVFIIMYVRNDKLYFL